MLKKSMLYAFLALSLLASPARAQDRVDLIVALDSSRSMFAYYGQVVEYVLSGVVREYMRSGDGFHLLSFSDSSQVEIAQVVRTESDLRSVIARLYLLYPLGRSTDLVSALKYINRYVGDLPQGSAKHIVLISDGMHSPAPSSPYASLDPEAVKSALEATASLIRERGWTLRIVRVPFNGSSPAGSSPAGSSPAGSSPAGAGGTGAASTATGLVGPSTGPLAAGGAAQGEEASTAPGSGDYLDDVARSADTEVSIFDPSRGDSSTIDAVTLPLVAFPSELGTRPGSFRLAADILNRSSKDISVELTGLLLEDGTDILARKYIAAIPSGETARLNLEVSLPDGLADGPVSLTIEPRFADGLRASPARSTVNLTLKRSPLPSFMRNTGLVALFLALLALSVAAVLAVTAYVRRAHRRATEPVIGAFIDSAASATGRSSHVSPYQVTTGAPEAHASPYQAAEARPSPHGIPSRPGVPVHASPYASAEGKPLAAAHAGARSEASAGKEAIEAASALAAAKSASREHGSAALLADAAAASRRPDPQAAFAAYRSSAKAHEVPLSSPKAEPVVAAKPRTPATFSAMVKRPASARLALHVRGQNTRIGLRNVRVMHAGGKASVGGGSSDFLIFLLPVPRRIGHLYFDGDDATFVPARMEFFPEYDGPIVDCLGKEIRAVTSRGKELVLTFDRYEAPEERVNRLLHCIEAPGLGLL